MRCTRYAVCFDRSKKMLGMIPQHVTNLLSQLSECVYIFEKRDRAWDEIRSNFSGVVQVVPTQRGTVKGKAEMIIALSVVLGSSHASMTKLGRMRNGEVERFGALLLVRRLTDCDA